MNTKPVDKRRLTLTTPAVVTVLALFCTALWGSAFPSIKTGYRLFEIDPADTASIILFAGMRFFLAGCAIFLVTTLLTRKMPIPKKQSWGNVLALSLTTTSVHYYFFYVALAHTTGVRGSIVNSTEVFFIFLTACLIFRQEKLTSRKIIGCVLGFTGVTLANLTAGSAAGLTGALTFRGEGFMVISCIVYAFAAPLVKKASANGEPALTLTSWQFLIGGATLIAVGFLMGGRLHPHGISSIGILLYLAFISSAAFSVWNLLLTKNPVSKVTIFGFCNTCFAVMLSITILHEDPGMPWYQLLAAIILVSTGVIIVNKKQPENIS